MQEYIFKLGNNIHSIQVKASVNSKIGVGYVIQTYHFSLEQVLNIDLKQDKTNCLNCPFSFSNGGEMSGKCYTHKGLQRLGLSSMLKRINKLYTTKGIEDWNSSKFYDFKLLLEKYPIALLRYGAYGEPSLLPREIFSTLKDYKRTGYTHAWNKFELQEFLMASVHTTRQMNKAHKQGWRTFRVTSKEEKRTKNEIECPASTKKATCITCKLCKGFDAKIKSIQIAKH